MTVVLGLLRFLQPRLDESRNVERLVLRAGVLSRFGRFRCAWSPRAGCSVTGRWGMMVQGPTCL